MALNRNSLSITHAVMTLNVWSPPGALLAAIDTDWRHVWRDVMLRRCMTSLSACDVFAVPPVACVARHIGDVRPPLSVVQEADRPGANLGYVTLPVWRTYMYFQVDRSSSKPQRLKGHRKSKIGRVIEQTPLRIWRKCLTVQPASKISRIYPEKYLSAGLHLYFINLE